MKLVEILEKVNSINWRFGLSEAGAMGILDKYHVTGAPSRMFADQKIYINQHPYFFLVLALSDNGL
jgi:hypothetical protein